MNTETGFEEENLKDVIEHRHKVVKEDNPDITTEFQDCLRSVFTNLLERFNGGQESAECSLWYHYRSEVLEQLARFSVFIAQELGGFLGQYSLSSILYTFQFNDIREIYQLENKLRLILESIQAIKATFKITLDKSTKDKNVD